MSGIAGIYNLDGRPVEQETIGRMVGAMSHRGPDGINTWRQGNVGLGHCMLHTTPESVYDRLPMQSKDGNLVLTADARIDNRDELIRMLRVKPYRDAPLTDCDLIMEAYQKWGEECPKYLIGDYAIAIWDVANSKLFLATDHMGIRNFFYYKTANIVLFATEIKSIVSSKKIRVIYNRLAISDHLTNVGRTVPGSTFYKNVFQFRPATAGYVSENRLELSKYWRLDTERELDVNSQEEVVYRFKSLFIEAVRSRLRSISPVGSTLSGGIDSSSISCTAELIMKKDNRLLNTFSCVFPDTPANEINIIDERVYIKSVVSKLNVKTNYIDASKISPLRDVDIQLKLVDDCFWGGNSYLHWLILSSASNQGILSLLDGTDGDSVVSGGSKMFSEIFIKNNFERLTKEISDYAKIKKVSEEMLVRSSLYPVMKYYLSKGSVSDFYEGYIYINRNFNISKKSFVKRVLLNKYIPAWIKRWREEKILNKFENNLIIINKDFAEGVNAGGIKDMLFMQNGNDEEVTSFNHRLNQARGLEQEGWSRSISMLDKMSAFHNIRMMYPFFDRHLMELSVSLPWFMKQNAGWSRYILREAMDGILPSVVQWRPDKARLGGNRARNMWLYDGEQISRMVHEGRRHLKPYVNMDRVVELVKYCEQQPDSRKKLRASGAVQSVFHLWRWLLKESKADSCN